MIHLAGRLYGYSFPSPANSYTTTFTGTENPLSEGGAFRTGLAQGLDWTDPQKAGGVCFGSQSIHGAPPFDDSVGVLATSYKVNQWCQGTLFVGAGASGSQEVELLLLSTINAHVIKLLEIDILLSGARIFIAQWNGALNDFTQLAGPITTNVSVANGAVWYAENNNALVTVKCNGSVVTTLDITGNSLLSGGGSPGVGFYRDNTVGTPGNNDQFCWTAFTAGEL